MATLSEIETVIEALPLSDKQQLLLFLAAQLRGQTGHLPAPRKFTSEQIHEWLKEDEHDLQRLRESSIQ